MDLRGVSVGIVLIAVLIPILVLGPHSTPTPSPTQQPRQTVQISDPSEHSQVTDGTVVRGKIDNYKILGATIVSKTCWTAGCSASLSSSEKTIWILTQNPGTNRFYPQGSWPDHAGPVLINAAGQWVSPAVFLGPTPKGAPILIIAVLVTHKEEDVFKGYLEHGFFTHNFSGLTPGQLPAGIDILNTVLVYKT